MRGQGRPGFISLACFSPSLSISTLPRGPYIPDSVFLPSSCGDSPRRCPASHSVSAAPASRPSPHPSRPCQGCPAGRHIRGVPARRLPLPVARRGRHLLSMKCGFWYVLWKQKRKNHRGPSCKNHHYPAKGALSNFRVESTSLRTKRNSDRDSGGATQTGEGEVECPHSPSSRGRAP